MAGKGRALSKQAGSGGNNWQKQGDSSREIDDAAEARLIRKPLGGGEWLRGHEIIRKQWL